MPTYPAQIDNSTTLPPVIDNFSAVTGSTYNKLREAVIAIEQELGIKPSGVYSTVKARLDALESIVGISGVLPTIKGGTGLSSYVTGDMLYASATNVLSRLAVGDDGYHLVVTGGLPSWVQTSILFGKTIVTSTPFTVSSNESIILTNLTIAGAVTINLEASPANGKIVIIKDAKGDGSTNNITINGTGGKTIDGSTAVAIISNYGKISLIYDSTSGWCVL